MRARTRGVMCAAIVVTALTTTALWLRTVAGGPVARDAAASSLAGFPTTRASGGEAYLFEATASPPLVLVPPADYFAFGGHTFGESAGRMDGGLLTWAKKGTTVAAGPVARGDGMIFVPPKPDPATGAPTTIRVLDELSRALIRTIVPPTAVDQLCWVAPDCRHGDDGGTLLAAGGNFLYAFDPVRGHVRWSLDVGQPILTAIARSGDTACVCIGPPIAPRAFTAPPTLPPDKPYELVAVNVSPTAVGRIQWRTALPGPPWGAPAVDTTSAYWYGAQDHGDGRTWSLRAFDLKTGRQKWDAPEVANIDWPTEVERIPPVPLERAPAVADDVICVPIAKRFCGVDASTGALRWARPVDATDPANSRRHLTAIGFGAPPSPSAVAGPVARERHFFVTEAEQGQPRSVLKALDPRTGREVWRKPNVDSSRETPLIIAGNVLAVGSRYRMPTSSTFYVLPTPAPGPYPPAFARGVPAWLTWAGAGGLLAALAVAWWIGWRRLFVAALSATLCAAAAWAWGRSYQSVEFIGAKSFATAPTPGFRYGGLMSERSTGLWSDAGALTIGQRQRVWETSTPRTVQGDTTSPAWWTRRPPREVLKSGVCLDDPPPPGLGLTHFAWASRARTSGTPLGDQAETSLTVPHWLPVAVLAVAPLAWLAGWRDRRRYPTGHCRRCGYDLRASPEKCPECGTAATSTA